MRWTWAALISGLAACSSPDDSDLFTKAASTADGGVTSADSDTSTDSDTASAATTTSAGTAGTTAGTGGSASGGSASDSTSNDATSSTSAGAATANSTGNGGAGGSSSAAEGSGGTGATGGHTTSSGDGGASCEPAAEVCDGQDNDCDDSIDEDQACPEDCSGAFFEGHSYLFCVAPLGEQGNRPARSWEWAMQYCLNQGQLLPRIETADENSFLYTMLADMAGSGDVWMAATNQVDEEIWMWATSRDSDDWIPFYDAETDEAIEGAFNDWRDRRPSGTNTSCGVLEDFGEDEWAWNTQNCGTELERLICEDAD